MSLIDDGLVRMGLEPDDDKVGKLNRFLKEIEFWNPRYGLVNAEGDQLIIRHILDSLAAVPFLRENKPESLADIGSGAGFPGIPLAIFLPEVRIDLVERSGRRVSFLRNAVLTLGLKNVTIRETALEKLSGRYDMITFRGFSPFTEELIGHLRNNLEDGGMVLAYKGKRSLIDEELASCPELGEVSIRPVSVPFLEEERHLVTLSL